MNIKADFPSLVEEIDFGTPQSNAEKQVTLTVDGRSITVPEGTSIMTLVALVRGDDFDIFTHPDRVVSGVAKHDQC